jgi:hypothetical protein
MPDPNRAIEIYLQKFLDLDQQRKMSPGFAQRDAEQALLRLCDFLRQNGHRIDDAWKIHVQRTLQQRPLVSYQAACGDALMDIGIRIR